jgi:broad specificity phosphatase PhoE
MLRSFHFPLSRRIFLVRHGQSVAQLPKAVTVSHDQIPLTEFGHFQAETFSKSVSFPPSFIISSSFLRAQQTASPLRSRYPSVPFEVWSVHEFTFLDPVKCFLTTRDQRRPYRYEYQNRNDPFYQNGVGAESFCTFVSRGRDFLKNIQKVEVDNIYVFTHSFFMRLIEMLLEPHPKDLKLLMRKFFAEVKNHMIENCEVICLRGI